MIYNFIWDGGTEIRGEFMTLLRNEGGVHGVEEGDRVVLGCDH